MARGHAVTAHPGGCSQKLKTQLEKDRHGSCDDADVTEKENVR
jgi:hypothetical protein